MKIKNGFTLIELLAVIVILAIIALIATPIVLNIINDAKEESGLRSADFYLDALELSIAQATLDGQNITDNTYNILDNGNLCLSYDASEKCIEELKVEVKGEVPKVGSIYIKNGQIDDVSLVLNNKTVIKNNEGELAYITKLEDICTHDSTNGVAAKTAGAKYTCKVKAGTSYTFYVLTTPSSDDTHVNLIMDQNINSDGTPAGMTGVTKSGDNVYNLVIWNSSGDTTEGPVTAMAFLHNATKDWTNIAPLSYIYKDRESQEITEENIGYISFISNNGIAAITPFSGNATTIGTKDVPLRARMPIYSRDATKTEVSNKKADNSNAYLYDNLDSSCPSAPYGYWTLYSGGAFSDYVWQVVCDGSATSGGADNTYAVRPVINLKL